MTLETLTVHRERKSEAGFSLPELMLTAGLSGVGVLLTAFVIANAFRISSFASSRAEAMSSMQTLRNKFSDREFCRCNLGGGFAGTSAIEFDPANLTMLEVPLAAGLRLFDTGCTSPLALVAPGTRHSSVTVVDLKFTNFFKLDASHYMADLTVSTRAPAGSIQPPPSRIRQLMLKTGPGSLPSLAAIQTCGF